jgi:hypothetical protein
MNSGMNMQQQQVPMNPLLNPAFNQNVYIKLPPLIIISHLLVPHGGKLFIQGIINMFFIVFAVIAAFYGRTPTNESVEYQDASIR